MENSGRSRLRELLPPSHDHQGLDYRRYVLHDASSSGLDGHKAEADLWGPIRFGPNFLLANDRSRTSSPAGYLQ
jgi:hypothetical protein